MLLVAVPIRVHQPLQQRQPLRVRSHEVLSRHALSDLAPLFISPSRRKRSASVCKRSVRDPPLRHISCDSALQERQCLIPVFGTTYTLSPDGDGHECIRSVDHVGRRDS